MIKMPYDKKIADQVLIMCDLFIQLAKMNNNILTLENLKETKQFFKKKYYNNKVELLEVEN